MTNSEKEKKRAVTPSFLTELGHIS